MNTSNNEMNEIAESRSKLNSKKVSIKNRLEQILKMFGNKIFYKLEIPLLTEDEFDDLPKENIIKYLLFIYEKFKGLLEQTIIIFDNFNLIHDNIMNLLNPVVVNINMKCIDINETEFMLLDTK
jgi:Mg2+ and Co2+ transporter CorA